MTKLVDLVDDALDKLSSSPDVSPLTVTDTVLDQIGDDCQQMREALKMLLPGYVGQRIGRRRNEALSGVANQKPKIYSGGFLSPKVKAIRDFYTELMDSQLHVGPNTYRRVGDCTRIDLLFAIDERKAQIKAEQARISQFKKLADLLPDDQVTVGALPRAAVETALAAKAA